MDVCCYALTSTESSLQTCDIYRDCPRGIPREAKICKNVLKWRTFERWITGKRLKINGQMLRCVWQVYWILFFTHVTFTAIVPGAYTGEAKMCLSQIAETDARSVGDSHFSCFDVSADNDDNDDDVCCVSVFSVTPFKNIFVFCRSWGRELWRSK